MKIKTSEATGPALDWLAAVCEGKAGDCEVHSENVWYGRATSGFVRWHPSTNWSQGGPIIEREEIYARPTGDAAKWEAMVWRDTKGTDTCGFKYDQTGPTPLIAAMRCYVASKLGDEIEIPEELT